MFRSPVDLVQRKGGGSKDRHADYCQLTHVQYFIDGGVGKIDEKGRDRAETEQSRKAQGYGEGSGVGA